MTEYPYIVKKRGRLHAAFRHPRDAENYVNSDAATINNASRTTGFYGPADYTIEDVESGRQVVGTTAHGHAILDALKRNAR